MNEYSTYVTSVIDGDTLETSTQTIRLANINVPESNTPQGQRSTDYLKMLIEGETGSQSNRWLLMFTVV